MPRSATPGVTLRSNGAYWQAAYRDSTGAEVVKGLGAKSRLTRTAAMAACKDIERKHILRPASRDTHNAPTLGAWLTRYTSLRENELADGTLYLVEGTGGYLKEFFGENCKLDAVTRAAAADWRKWLERKPGNRRVPGPDGKPVRTPLSDAAICGHVRRAKHIFKLAEDQGLVELNPFKSLRGQPADTVKDWYRLKDEEVPKLLEAASGSPWRALIALCAYGGLRRGEALLLTWADVKWGEGKLLVQEPKDTRGRRTAATVHPRREVLMEPELERELLAAREAHGDRGARVAPVTTHRHNLWRDMVATIKRAGLAAGWKGDPFKTLRRYRASAWRLRYAEPFVDAWMGHSQEVAREHYVTVPEALYGGKAETALATALRRVKELEAKLLAKAG